MPSVPPPSRPAAETRAAAAVNRRLALLLGMVAMALYVAITVHYSHGF